MKNPVVSALATSRPKLVFLILGKKAMLAETLFWRRVLTPVTYAWVIDFFLNFLFGWKTRNLDPQEKPLLYAHLYSYSSVKALVHWFQITETKSFQAFDDMYLTSFKIPAQHNKGYRSYMLPRQVHSLMNSHFVSYNPGRIPCPMALFWGGKDTVPDVEWLLSVVPEGTYTHKEEDYEHLDFMWAKDVQDRVNSRVIKLMQNVK